MTLTRRIYDAVAAMQPTSLQPIVDALADSGAKRSSIRQSLYVMTGKGWISSNGKRGFMLYRTGAGAPPDRPEPSPAANPAVLKRRMPGNTRVSVETTPALQPIWPAVAGAPIGGLSPCIG